MTSNIFSFFCNWLQRDPLNFSPHCLKYTKKLSPITQKSHVGGIKYSDVKTPPPHNYKFLQQPTTTCIGYGNLAWEYKPSLTHGMEALAKETVPERVCRLALSVKYVQVYSLSNGCPSADEKNKHMDLSSAMTVGRVESWWRWSQKTDLLQVDVEILQHRGGKSAAAITIWLCQRGKRVASVLTGGPVKPTGIQNWLLQSTMMPGNCTHKKNQSTHFFFCCLNIAVATSRIWKSVWGSP